MKRLVLIALAAASMAHAGWFKTYGGSAQDKGYCVQVTNDSNYIVSGYKGNDLWLFKTDTSGNILWEHTYEGRAGRWVEQTADDGYIVAGGKLLKTDSEGDSLWMRDVGIYSRCVQQTTDGGYIVTGGVDSGFPYYLALLKTNPTGDSIWMCTYLLPGWVASNGYFVRQTNDNGYVVTGYLTDTLYGEQRAAFWLFKTDSIGEMIWSYTQGGENWGDVDNGSCVRIDVSMEYITLANFGLLKFNQQGDTLWIREYKNGSRMQVTEDEGYILTGDGASLLTSSSVVNPADVWLLKTNEQGESSWKHTYIEGRSYCVAQTPDKGYIATGVDWGDLFLLKTDSLGLVGIRENPIVIEDCGWKVVHPIGSYIVLYYEDLPHGFQANVFDVLGRKVDEIRGDGNEGAMTWGINQPPGVYFIQALDNRNQLKTAKVVLVR